MREPLDPRLLDGDDVWRAAWRALPRVRRRAIRAAVMRGQPRDEPFEAALAIGLVRWIVSGRKSGPWAALHLGGSADDLQLQNAEEANLAVVAAHVREERP